MPIGSGPIGETPIGGGGGGDSSPDPDVITEVYTILDQDYDRHRATIELGPPNFFRTSCPWRRFSRTRCGADWENRHVVGALCAYPSDEFEADTSQSFTAGADDDAAQERLYGWSTINIAAAIEAGTICVANVDAADTDAEGELLGIDGSLYLESDSPSIEWSSARQEAPYAFKELEGDFDVETRVDVYGARVGMAAGILAQEIGDDYDSWVLAAVGRDGDLTPIVLEQAAASGVATVGTALESEATYIRLARSGDDFTAYYSTDGETWTTLATETVSLQADVRVGLVLAAPATEVAVAAAGFPWFRFRSGGLSTCPRTLEGCRERGNTHRFFGFPGMLRP